MLDAPIPRWSPAERVRFDPALSALAPQDTFANDVKGVMVAAMDKYSGPDATAIDFGCGAGRYLKALAERNGSVVGIDISRKLLEIAGGECEQAVTAPLLPTRLGTEEGLTTIRKPAFFVSLVLASRIPRKVSKGSSPAPLALSSAPSSRSGPALECDLEAR